MSVTTIGIAGITGKFGRLLATHLLRQPSVSLKGFCRNPSNLAASLSSSPRIALTQGNADDITAARSFAKGCDVVVCCYLGPNTLMVDGQEVLIDACEEEKVPRYIASDFCLDFTRLSPGDHPGKDFNKTIYSYLQTKSHVKGVHVLIGVLMETFWSQIFGLWDQESRTMRYWGTEEEEWECTTYSNSAEYVAAVALDESAVGVKKFVGDRKSTLEAAAVFEQVYGVKPKTESRGSLEDLYKAMHKTKDKNPAAAMVYMPMFYNYYCSNGQTHLNSPLDNSKYPSITPTTHADYLKQHSIDGLWAARLNVASDV